MAHMGKSTGWKSSCNEVARGLIVQDLAPLAGPECPVYRARSV